MSSINLLGTTSLGNISQNIEDAEKSPLSNQDANISKLSITISSSAINQSLTSLAPEGKIIYEDENSYFRYLPKDIKDLVYEKTQPYEKFKQFLTMMEQCRRNVFLTDNYELMFEPTEVYPKNPSITNLAAYALLRKFESLKHPQDKLTYNVKHIIERNYIPPFKPLNSEKLLYSFILEILANTENYTSEEILQNLEALKFLLNQPGATENYKNLIKSSKLRNYLKKFSIDLANPHRIDEKIDFYKSPGYELDATFQGHLISVYLHFLGK